MECANTLASFDVMFVNEEEEKGLYRVLLNGFGKSFFNNGNKYEGEYKDGFKHGKGTFTVQVSIHLIRWWLSGNIRCPWYVG